MTAREFDIVVLGATGFTGALVAEYLLERYGSNGPLRWAIAGRSAPKLDALVSKLGAPASELKTMLADSFDDESLQRLARRSRVVLTTVGPYARYGSALVAACARNGTHYCDLAGEVQWVRRMIDSHQEPAAKSGARIVHCCGFDSVPMDIGAWYFQREAKRRYGAYCESIVLLVKAMQGAASGGTLASMLNVIREARSDRDVARVLASPYCLNPEGQRQGPDGGDQRRVLFEPEARTWTAPFVMATVNTRVVRRTHALQGFAYGKDFRYREAVMTGKGAAGWIKATSITAGLNGFMLAASFATTRAALQRFVLPKPGEGPGREAREAGFFNLVQFGRLPDGTIIRGRITGDKDPGYGSTSKMLAECAVCLAMDDLDVGGGSLTPAAAMAAPLLARLQSNAGLTFELIDE